MQQILGISQERAKKWIKRLKIWLRDEWFQEERRSPSVIHMLDGFVQAVLLESISRKWKDFLAPLNEPTNKFINACVACAAPGVRYACGAGCKTVLYCGQDCADAHWEEHNCRK
jgi:hypothetical protein